MPNVTSDNQNRLRAETSPYLLQHADNPVDWWAWCPEALEQAVKLDRPIFLSIGYSACHWCHVMAHECFENEAIARLMNASFINIKVDREERPDLDEIYMKAVTALTQSGGWPMSVFLTPDLKPFYGGTYFPPDSRFGRPGFPDVLRTLAELWQNDRPKLLERGDQLRDMICKEAAADTSGAMDPEILDKSFAQLHQSYDTVWGGFGSAPKFPHAGDVRICLRHWKRTGNPLMLDVAASTLDRMSEGGMYDQLGGGFHRYSTDEMWLIPHFEKMLYDNALLIPTYLEGYLATGNKRYARIAAECCEWVLREMLTPEGGFASAQDADSEGEEGAFFVWTPQMLMDALGDPIGIWAAEWFGVTEEGNFENGNSALWRHDTARDVSARLNIDEARLIEAMREARKVLFAGREERVHPQTDDKVLTAWNGLMIGALAQAYQVLGDERYLDAARRSAKLLLGPMRQSDGRLFATSRNGRAHLNACLDDYAFLIAGLIDLFEADFDENWLREALALNEVLTEKFLDRKHGGYFTTGVGHEELLARLKSPQDGALPSGNGVQALNLLRLGELTGDPSLGALAEQTIRSVAKLANQYPMAFSGLLQAVDFAQTGGREIVVAGKLGDETTEQFLRTVRQSFLPQRVVAVAHPDADPKLLPLVEGRQKETSTKAFVCRNQTCELPAESAAQLAEQLK